MRHLFGFTRKRVYQLLAANEIKSALIGRRRFIVIATVHDYIGRRAADPILGRTPNQRVRRNDTEDVSPSPDVSESVPPGLARFSKRSAMRMFLRSWELAHEAATDAGPAASG
jgi:hypothetical protein